MSKSIKPTESELEILKVLWQQKECSVREVHESLGKKEAGYTTTLKLMQIMHEKGLVERDTSARTHLYRPAINQQDTEQQIVSKLIDHVFNGSASRLVMQALGNKKASQEEIEKIKAYLNQLDQSHYGNDSK